MSCHLCTIYVFGYKFLGVGAASEGSYSLVLLHSSAEDYFKCPGCSAFSFLLTEKFCIVDSLATYIFQLIYQIYKLKRFRIKSAQPDM